MSLGIWGAPGGSGLGWLEFTSFFASANTVRKEGKHGISNPMQFNIIEIPISSTYPEEVGGLVTIAGWD